MSTFKESEYHRRNLQVARVLGAKAAVDQALERAREVKRIPKWLLRYLESAAERLPGLSSDLAAFRDASPDYDQWGPEAAGAREAARQAAQRAGA
jgi:hypothetical protein